MIVINLYHAMPRIYPCRCRDRSSSAVNSSSSTVDCDLDGAALEMGVEMVLGVGVASREELAATGVVVAGDGAYLEELAMAELEAGGALDELGIVKLGSENPPVVL